MKIMNTITGLARSPGDPEVIKSGPSSKGLPEHTARALGWFSIVLGAAELFAPRQLAQTLGMEGQENLLRAYGARELASGRMCLSVDKTKGAWSRVAGDLLDLATLFSAFKDDNPKKRNVGIAIAAVAAITLIDAATAQALTARHARGGSKVRSYRDRSGFPQGLSQAKGAAARSNSTSSTGEYSRVAAQSVPSPGGGAGNGAPHQVQ